MKKAIIIGALPESLINFRGQLIQDLQKEGIEIIAMSAPANKDVCDALADMGVKFLPYRVKRSGLNPLADLFLLVQLIKIFKDQKPDFVLAYTVKPVVWGGIASRILNIPFYALVTGLGFAFQGHSFFRKKLQSLVTVLYRLSLKGAREVIFQNQDNAKLFMEKHIVSSDRSHVVNGSGVDTMHFSHSPLNHSKLDGVTFLCVARLLRDKGLREYAEAAERVIQVYPNASFNLVGPSDPSPDGIPLEEVHSWEAIRYHGESRDVRDHLKACDVYVLPSYHEGLPRSTLEAMAIGRTIITTDAVGCRDTVEQGLNGFCVKVGDSKALAQKMIWCIENSEALVDMGGSSRQIVEKKFDVKSVNQEILTIMKVL